LAGGARYDEIANAFSRRRRKHHAASGSLFIERQDVTPAMEVSVADHIGARGGDIAKASPSSPEL
jgi:hypothetical protein